MRQIDRVMCRVCATRFANSRGFTATCVTLVIGLLSLAAGARVALAGQLELRVLDRDGRGVANVVVIATAIEPARVAAVAAPGTAVMDQQARQFVPQVLVVQTGTSVAFPNNDSVSHQVYSFSPARRFQLPLYKGEVHSPVSFDSPGLVVLGCNIHDEMVGYIYVTASPHFATTDALGHAAIAGLPAGRYRLDAWGPRVVDPSATLAREVSMDPTGTVVAEWRLVKPLRLHPSPGPRDVDWDY